MSITAGEMDYLVGGISMKLFSGMVFRILEQGTDGRKLGRWGHITITC